MGPCGLPVRGCGTAVSEQWFLRLRSRGPLSGSCSLPELCWVGGFQDVRKDQHSDWREQKDWCELGRWGVVETKSRRRPQDGSILHQSPSSQGSQASQGPHSSLQRAAVYLGGSRTRTKQSPCTDSWCFTFSNILIFFPRPELLIDAGAFQLASPSTAPSCPTCPFLIPKLVDKMLVMGKNTISSHLENLMFFFF